MPSRRAQQQSQLLGHPAEQPQRKRGQRRRPTGLPRQRSTPGRVLVHWATPGHKRGRGCRCFRPETYQGEYPR
jgi:hypothetical protein